MPSLDLRFAESKSLIDAVSGRQLVTFTRASSGTFVGSDGLIKTAAVNEPRFDHDPVTGESLGLLAEEARTNLVVRSEEFSNSSIWTTSGSIARNANADTAPDGTLTADQLIFAAADNLVSQAVTIASGISYAASIWIKGAAGETIRLSANGIPGGGNFTLTGGWTRHSFVGTSNSTNGSLNISTFSGATARSIYVWGAQLEAGDFATSYIPTTTATATRSTDVASIQGDAFSSWYRQDEGTVFADFRGFPIRAGEFPRVVDFNDGVSSNSIRLQQYASNVVRASIIEGGVTQMAEDTETIAQGVQGKAILAVATNACAATVNGGVPVRDSSAAVPSGLTRLNILAGLGQTSVANSSIRRLTYWPRRIDNNTLQELTR
jgi:hypothetical protein